MTVSFFMTVLALSTPFPIIYGSEGSQEKFHPPKSTFFRKLNQYLFFEDTLNGTDLFDSNFDLETMMPKQWPAFGPWKSNAEGNFNRETQLVVLS